MRHTPPVRIVAGSARGRVLKVPRNAGVIRPTADRVRESIFNILGQRCDGLEVLDLFAGTGALGLEAMSRGASRVVMVDSGIEAKALCLENAAALKMNIEFVHQSVEGALPRLGQQAAPFDLIFADPPYGLQCGTRCLEQIDSLKLLKAQGRLVFESSVEERIEDAGCLRRSDERIFGATKVSIFELT
jgi:16S rRNA (guanine966-N2)-methyltransferase